jgi:hypothetical protein
MEWVVSANKTDKPAGSGRNATLTIAVTINPDKALAYSDMLSTAIDNTKREDVGKS